MHRGKERRQGKALRRPRKIVLRLVGGLLLGGMLLGGCGESPPSDEATQPSAAVSTVRPATPSAAAVRFTEVTSEAGLSFRHEAGATGKKWYPETMGAGGGFFDYDSDGLVDILLVNGRHWPGERQAPEPTMRLYRNQGDGTFRDVTRQSKLAVPLYGMGMAAADYDNDGDQDLVLTAYRHTVLFRNEGDGTFTDISAQAGIVQGGWSTAAMFVDVDRDGWLDLLVGHYVDWDPAKEENLDCTYGTPRKDYCAVKYFRGQGLRFYRNLGDGRFRQATEQAGLAAPEARVLGLAMVDYNQDGWPDILIANDLTPSLFFANQGDGTFRDIGVPSGLVLDEGGVAFAGMGIDATYINNDGQLCVAIGNFTGQPTTLHCQVRTGSTYRPDIFTEQSHRAGLARPTLRMVTFGLFFFDVDLDGWQDLFMVNGHVVDEERLRNVPYAQRPQLFRNRGGGRFVELVPAPQSGLDIRLVGRGAAYADYDNDGDLDLLLTANQGPVHLLRNDTPRRGHFLRLVTRGRQSNRDGIGARVRLVTAQRQLTGMVRTGGSYLSQSEKTLTFGLRPEEQIERLEVSWPSGAVDVFRDLQPDATFVAREGTAPAAASGTRVAAQSSGAETDLAAKRTAMAHYRAGRLEAAIAAFQQALQQQPADYIVQQYLIELYWRRGEPDKAHELLEAMGRASPDANFLMQFAFHLEDVQLRELADAVYRLAARLDPQAPEAPYRLGKNALQAGRNAEAVSYFQQALQRRPDLVSAAQGLGLAYAALRRTAEAEAQFQKVLRLAPDFAEAHSQLGQLYARTGRLDQALAAYRTVIRLQPERAQGYHNLGAVLMAKGRQKEAMTQFREALRRDPHYLPAHNDLGTLYAEQGDFERAMAEFQAAVTGNPTSVQARYNLAMAHGARGELGPMIRELQETLRLDPQHREARLNLGIGYLRQGRTEAAAEQFRHVVEAAPQLAEAHYFLAVTYAQLGQEDAMLAALLQTVRLDPDHARAHSALASFYFQRHQYDLAWQHGTKAAQLGAPVQRLLEALQQVREPGQ
jgi:tetratricopeptide (TPR) repeat protein